MTEKQLSCKLCPKVFGTVEVKENVFEYIRHLHYTHLICSHEILRDLDRYDLPEIICEHGGIHK